MFRSFKHKKRKVSIIIVYIWLVYKRVNGQQNTMVSGSGAVENNKHQALSFPIYVGFKRTPYDTKSYGRTKLNPSAFGATPYIAGKK